MRLSRSTRYRMPCYVVTDLVRRALIKVLLRTRCDCIALSAGIDTATIAALAKYLGINLRGYATYYANGLPRDLPYINYLEKKLNIRVTYIVIDDDYVRRRIKLIKKCVSVDSDVIELRNDLVFYSVLERALSDGCKCIYTGSGGDEVFIGYRFMIYKGCSEIEELIRKYAIRGRYPELMIGECLGINVVAPYLSNEVLDIALKIPIECLRDNLMRGKEVLRSILKSLGIDYIASRVKAPAEAGAGTDTITSL